MEFFLWNNAEWIFIIFSVVGMVLLAYLFGRDKGRGIKFFIFTFMNIKGILMIILRILLWVVVAYLVYLLIQWVLGLIGLAIPQIFFTMALVIVIILIVMKIVGVIK
jgi:hypothetical protein